MTQFYSRVDTYYDGDTYSIPFSYSKESEISVYIDDEEFDDWEFLNESQIQLTEIPTDIDSNSVISIRRNTDISEKVVEYTNNTMLSKDDLNLSQDQLLQAVQEVYDNNIQFEEELTEEVQSDISGFKEEINEIVENYQEESESAFEEFKTEVSAQIAEYKSDTDSQIAEFEETVNTSISNMETEISEFETSVNTSISEFKDEVESEVTEFEDTTNTTVETFKADITNMLTEVIDAAESIETLYESIETTAEAASEAAAQAAAAQEAAESLTSALEQVETNTTNIAANTADISELEERLTTDETAIETNASDIAALQESVASNTSVIDSLDSTYLPLAGNSYSTNPVTGCIYFASSGRKLVNFDPNIDSTGTISNPNGTSSTHFLTDCSASAGTGGGWLGGYELYIDTSDVVTSSIGARNRVDGTSYTCTIRAMVDTDGTCYTYAPTPSNNDDSTKIATTAFVSNMLTGSNSNFITFSKSSSGYYTFNNGLKLQWGRGSSVGYDTTTSITFPTSFSSSTSYKVIATTYNTTGSGDQMNIHITAQSSTTFSAYVYRIEGTASGTRYLQWIAIGY